MNFAAIFNQEPQYLDNTEAVTLFRRTAEGTLDNGMAVANAFRLEVEKDSERGLVKNSLTWLLWNSQTNNPAPKKQDVIKDAAGIRWSILTVDIQAWGARYSIETVQER